MVTIEKIISELKVGGYLDAAEYIERQFGTINRTAEFGYMKAFIIEGYFENETDREQLRALWTAYCCHHGLNVDTGTYDAELTELWRKLNEVGSTFQCVRRFYVRPAGLKGEIEMNVTRKEKKAEALVRMKLWGIYAPIRKQFEKEDLVSESAPPLGACYWLDEAQRKRVAEFEEQNNALVYHVIHSYTSIGEMESYLYVSDYPEEWERDREDIKDGQQLVYVFNHDMPDCSEFGSIGVALTPAAGLRRTW